MPDAAGATRVKTGIRGLDEILGGGLPSRRVHLVQGNPGAGKTTLALQFLLDGARQGERGLYISLSETREEVQTVAASHGWELGDLTIFEASRLGDEDENTLFDTSEVELGERMQSILSDFQRVLGPRRVPSLRPAPAPRRSRRHASGASQLLTPPSGRDRRRSVP